MLTSAFVLRMLLLPSLPPLLADAAIDQCTQNLHLDFEEYLSDITVVEKSFRDLAWQNGKYREMVYNPLWQAVQDSRGDLNPDIQRMAMVQKERYLNLAEVYRSEVGDGESALQETMNRITERLTVARAACAVPSYSQCMQEWRDPMLLVWEDFRKLIDQYLAEQAELNQNILQSLEDSPSDHAKLAERDFLVSEVWHKKTYPAFHALLRQFREGIEGDWPAEKCCALCTERAVRDFETNRLDQFRGHELVP